VRVRRHGARAPAVHRTREAGSTELHERAQDHLSRALVALLALATVHHKLMRLLLPHLMKEAIRGHQ
jgi:hypothetical protein